MMGSISVHNTEALGNYYHEHIYDPSDSFEWIRWADKVIAKNAFLGIFAAVFALGIYTSHKQFWELKHWLRYKKTPTGYIPR